MVDSLATYLTLLQRGVALFDELAEIYAPDMAYDWANRTLMQIGNTRMGLADRLAKPKLSEAHTLAVMGLIDRYVDGHWADYTEIPKPDPAKRAQVLSLHEKLTAVMNEVVNFHNALFVDL